MLIKHIEGSKRKTIRSEDFQSNTESSEKATVDSKYDCEHQYTCNILIMFFYLMISKLIYLLSEHETVDQFLALEQVRGILRTPSNIYNRMFCQNCSINLKSS